MHIIYAKILLRILGTLGVFWCLHFSLRACILASEGAWVGVALVVILGLYFAYVTFLTWFNFSPRAIRHICIGTLYWMFFIGRVPIKLVSDMTIQGLLSILLIFGLVKAYGKIWRYFSVLIFAEPEKQKMD